MMCDLLATAQLESSTTVDSAESAADAIVEYIKCNERQRGRHRDDPS